MSTSALAELELNTAFTPALAEVLTKAKPLESPDWVKALRRVPGPSVETMNGPGPFAAFPPTDWVKAALTGKVHLRVVGRNWKPREARDFGDSDALDGDSEPSDSDFSDSEKKLEWSVEIRRKEGGAWVTCSAAGDGRAAWVIEDLAARLLERRLKREARCHMLKYPTMFSRWMKKIYGVTYFTPR